MVLFRFKIVNRADFHQFFGFRQHIFCIAVVKGITQLQAGEAGQVGMDARGSVQIFQGSRIIAAAECGLCQQQIAGKLLFIRQFFDVFQVVVAQFEVFHLVGGMRAQHQREVAVVAGFFVFQYFGGFLLRFFKAAFKKRQTCAVQSDGCLTAFARRAETLHTGGDVHQADDEFD